MDKPLLSAARILTGYPNLEFVEHDIMLPVVYNQPINTPIA